MPECEDDTCPCHGPAVDMPPPHVIARMDQVIAQLTDDR